MLPLPMGIVSLVFVIRKSQRDTRSQTICNPPPPPQFGGRIWPILPNLSAELLGF